MDYTLTDAQAYASPQHIPRNWLIRIIPEAGVEIDDEFGDYRICANDITISGLGVYSNPNAYGENSQFDLGRNTFMASLPDASYNSTTGFVPGESAPVENFGWILSDPVLADTLDSDWINPSNFIGQIDDETNTWYGNYSTSSEWGGSGTRPKVMTSGYINYILGLPNAAQSQLAQQNILNDQNAANASSLDAIYSWTWFDTTGVDENGIGLATNEVIMIVTLKDGWEIPMVAEGGYFPILESDIDGTAHFIAAQAAAMIINPDITFQSGLTIDNSPNTTITVTTDYTVTQETEDKGFTKQKENLVFSGTVQGDKPTKIASIKIETDSGYYLSKKPYLTTKFGDNISTSISSKTKSSGKINSYTIDVVYNNNKRTPTIGYPTGSVMCKIEEVYVRPIQIDSFSINTSNIVSRGENRIIRITGAPGATFGLAVNENFQNKMVDPNSDVTITRYVINKGDDISILNPGRVGGIFDNGYGKKLPVLKGTLNSKGIHTFSQRFPSVVAVKTKTSASKTPATPMYIDLDSNSGIRVDDKMYARQITGTSAPKVTAIDANGVRITIDTPITIGDDETVTFKRNKCYSVSLLEDLTSTLGSSITKTEYNLKQYADSVLRLRLTEGSGSSFTITEFNDVVTGLSAGDDHDIVHTGAVGRSKAQLIKVKYKISCSANITRVNTPVFNLVDQSKSSWTNSVINDNYGMSIRISNFTSTAIGSTTITLTFDLKINTWGKEDTTMALDLDDVLTHA